MNFANLTFLALGKLKNIPINLASQRSKHVFKNLRNSTVRIFCALFVLVAFSSQLLSENRNKDKNKNETKIERVHVNKILRNVKGQISKSKLSEARVQLAELSALNLTADELANLNYLNGQIEYQSGAYDKAITFFESVVSLDSANNKKVRILVKKSKKLLMICYTKTNQMGKILTLHVKDFMKDDLKQQRASMPVKLGQKK